jgi:hypothetical protein
MGYYGRAAVVSGPGTWLGEEGQAPAPEDIAAHWQAVISLEGAQEYANLHAAVTAMLTPPSPQSKRQGDKETGRPEDTAQGVFERMGEFFQAERAGGVDVQAYTSGRLKIAGDLMKSQLIEKLFRFR